MFLSTKKEIDLTKTTIVHSILPNLSKVFDRCLCKQISTFFEDILSRYRCGFGKEHKAEHCLLPLIEKWKQNVDHRKSFGTLLTDLSKVFDCLSPSLFIAKLKAYGFDNDSFPLFPIIYHIASKGLKLAMNIAPEKI